MSVDRRPRALQYGIALVATVAAVVITLVCRQLLTQTLSTVYVAAVAATALFAGTGPALLTLALSVPIADYLLHPESFAFALNTRDIVRMVFLALSSLLIVAMTAARDRAERRLRRREIEAAREAERLHAHTTSVDAERRAIEARLHDVVEGLDAIVWEADARPFRLTFVNQRAETVFGHPVARWTDDPTFRERELVHPDDRLRLAAACREAIEHGGGYDCEFRAVGVDGRVRWMREIVHVTRDPRGAARTLGGVLIDVTRTRLAERSLRVQHAVASVLAEARTLAEATPRIMEAVCAHLDWEWGALWSVDEPAQLLRFVASWHLPSIAMPAFEAASRERTFAPGIGLPGRVWMDATPTWIREVALDGNFPRAAAAVRDGLHGAFAFPVLLGGTVLGVLEFFSRAVREPDESLLDTLAIVGGQIGQFLEHTHAETLRHELLRREQAARTEAEAASRAKDEFLATVSHELRAPLTPILLWTRMLRNGAVDAPTAAHALEVIEANAKGQAQLVEDLLDVSRIVTGNLRLEMASVALAPVIEAALDAVRPAADVKGVALATTFDPGIASVSGDANRLQQVAWNLLANAVKFTPRGGTVDVRLRRIDDEVELSVHDTGKGITAEFLPHVFERFQQADGASTRAHGGLGLGLAIVRHLVELHGGSVSADSAGEGRGTTFAVRLPQRAAALPVRAATSDARRDTAEGRLHGRRVLVVDDDTDTRQALAAVLARAGAELRVAESAAEALEALREWRADVLVSDVGLPGEDGYALLRRVRALPADAGGSVPAIALTGFARAEDRERGRAAGFDRHLVKPVEPADLIDVISTLAAEPRPAPAGLVAAEMSARVDDGVPTRADGAGSTSADDGTSTRPNGRAATAGSPSVGDARAMASADDARPDGAAMREALATVSHELRQPLAAMRIWLNLLEAEMGDELSADARDNLAQIRASVTWMVELIATKLTD